MLSCSVITANSKADQWRRYRKCRSPSVLLQIEASRTGLYISSSPVHGPWVKETTLSGQVPFPVINELRAISRWAQQWLHGYRGLEGGLGGALRHPLVVLLLWLCNFGDMCFVSQQIICILCYFALLQSLAEGRTGLNSRGQNLKVMSLAKEQIPALWLHDLSKPFNLSGLWYCHLKTQSPFLTSSTFIVTH